MNPKNIVKIILDEIKVINKDYNKLYVNVDDLEDGNGFLRLLAMQDFNQVIFYEAIYPLDLCYQILDILAESKYSIIDFTMK